MQQVRKSKALSQRAVAEKIGAHFSQVSLVERGANVEVQWYERIAHALGFKNALEMFGAGDDDLMRRLLRLWKRLPDDEARKEVLKLIQRQIVLDVERDAI